MDAPRTTVGQPFSSKYHFVSDLYLMKAARAVLSRPMMLGWSMC
jgi:hypothetical protein